MTNQILFFVNTCFPITYFKCNIINNKNKNTTTYLHFRQSHQMLFQLSKDNIKSKFVNFLAQFMHFLANILQYRWGVTFKRGQNAKKKIIKKNQSKTPKAILGTIHTF